MSAPTPHIQASKADFAPTVLMPGDPLRARFIAETFLTDARLVNNVRGVQGYTGTYEGKRVSVMASGMGMPSMGIYSYELYNDFGVQTIIRIGSAGAIHPALQLKDIVAGQAACTDSAFADQFALPGRYAPICDFATLQRAVAAAEALGLTLHVGNLFSTDAFYDDRQSMATWQKMGVLAVEMEAAALYMNAARAGKAALCLCTISDKPITGGEACTAEERERTFTDMMRIALRIA